MQPAQRQQTGSIVAYVVVGLLLAVASVAAIVAVRNYDAGDKIASRPITEAPSDPDKAAQKSTDADKEKATKDAAEREKEQATQKAHEAEAEAAAEQKAADEAKAAEEAARVAAESEAATADGPMATAGAQVTTGELPTTGPAEDLLSMVIGLVAIVGAGYVYYHYGTKQHGKDEA